MTKDGGLKDAFSKFTFDGTSNVRTLKFTKSQTWTDLQKKTYTIVIKVKFPTKTGTFSPKTYNF